MRVENIISRYLPTKVALLLHRLPKEIFDGINEIRIRKKAPLSITARGKNLFIDASGKICSLQRGVKCDEADIKECILRLTDGSVYTCDEYMAMGFIPLPEGGRAGICGKALIRGGQTEGFSEITSVNLRIHRNIPYFASPLIEEYRKNGCASALVCAPPALGKTTFLRSAAYMLANGKDIPPKRVGIADERMEISPGIGETGTADIISGMEKSKAISILTRTMAPEIIICDEISPNESPALSEAQHTGVCLIASAHGRGPADIAKRGRMRDLLYQDMFPITVIIKAGFECEIHQTKELL